MHEWREGGRDTDRECVPGVGVRCEMGHATGRHGDIELWRASNMI